MRRSPARAAAFSPPCARPAPRARTSSCARRCRRLDALIAEGVGTVEVKSGYGLDLAAERKSLRVARRLAAGTQHRDPRDLPRRTRGAARIRGQTRRLCRLCRRCDDPGAGGRRPDRRGRRFLREHRLHPRRDRPRVRRREARGASGQAARRSIVELGRRRACRRSLAHSRPIISNMRTNTALPPWRPRASSRCCCRAPIMC